MKAINLFGPLGLVLVVVAAREDAGSSYERIVLSEGVYTEGASFGDVDGDGQIDLLAGPLWWAGPDFKVSHRYRAGEAVPAKGYAHNSFQSWVRDMNGDGRADVFQVSHDGNFHLDLYLQPKERSEEWPRYRVVTKMGNESPELADVTGDGKEELVAMQEGKFGFFQPDWSAPENPWVFHAISKERAKSPYYHGLGFGDLNGDGRVDVLEKGGWYEGPENPMSGKKWTFHPYLFSVNGGAQMLVYDVDGDGDQDVVTSLAGHAWGLAWFENDGLKFTRHVLIPEDKSAGVGGVVFTQAHSLVAGDFNGDGLTDFATGKRYFAHNGNDPDAGGAAVLYWYELRRKDGKAEFVPHLVDSDSGAGTQLAAADVNGDGKTDLGVGNKKGVYVFKSR
ncbi:MAG: FG-GAP repeat domain-containing protein [Verrucomicrobiaceae bacterium]